MSRKACLELAQMSELSLAHLARMEFPSYNEGFRPTFSCLIYYLELESELFELSYKDEYK